MYVEAGRHLTIPCDMPENLMGRYIAYWYKETDENQLEIYRATVRICTSMVSGIVICKV